MKTALSEKGQVTIPKRIRVKLGLRPGTVIEFSERSAEGGKATAKKFENEELDQLIRGCLRRGERPPVKAWVD